MNELEPYGATSHGTSHQDDRDDLLEYLKTARDLEVGLLELEKMAEHQREQVDVLGRKQYPIFDPPHKNIADERNRANAGARSAGSTIGGICGLLYAIFDGWHMVSDSNNPFSLVGNFFVFVIAAGIVVAIGAGIGTLVAAATSSSKNQKVSDEKERENDAAREKWLEETQRMRARDAEAIRDFKQNLAVLTEAGDYFRQILDEHYNGGPVYYKYQTLPAVCQLYEYFDSGRFTTLGDAYNQYELEVRLDRLIDNSERALALLSDIRDNQRLLYDALVDVRASISAVNQKLDVCIANLDRVTYASEVTAVCSRQTALATTLLSQVVYYKNYHNLPLFTRGLEAALAAYDARLSMRREER